MSSVPVAKPVEAASTETTPASWLRLGLSLFGLNLALSFHNWWPTPWVTIGPELSIEATVCALMLALMTGRGRVPSRGVLGVIAALFLVLMAGHYAEVTAAALYGRPINLYWDAQHLHRVAAMLARADGWWLVAALGLALAALLVTLFLALRWMLTNTVAAMAEPAPRRAVTVIGAALAIAFTAGHLRPSSGTLSWFSPPVSLSFGQHALLVYRTARSETRHRTVSSRPLTPSSLAAISGADVIVVFLESYGAVTFDNPRHARSLAPARAELAEAVAQTGLEAVSALVTSPTFGGVSWLAHASLLTGIEVVDSGRYERLLRGDRETLPQRFTDHGYRTLGLMPGLRQPWPEGRFYGFDLIYDATGLAYRGPEFGWWRIPDQFALAHLDSLELQPRPRRPVFAFFTTISSHIPFRPTPPLQSDWDQLLGPAPYPSQLLDGRLQQTPEWTDLESGYLDAVDYTLRLIGSYLTERAPEDLVLVLIGDHQPAASITGPDATWAVPVHIISTRPSVLDSLRGVGFASGLGPTTPALGPMHELTAHLLRAFDGQPLVNPSVHPQ